MKITKELRLIINRLPRGYIFTYDDFKLEVKNKESIIKALNRMAKSNEIAKLQHEIF
ncbi:MAG: hypothetical protein KGO93_09580 [Cyanobacteria bacterium REEB446]|jgi:hypothetical protein|nr:hypothetical protein [Cyanobacteria bacterium REEB446]